MTIRRSSWLLATALVAINMPCIAEEAQISLPAGKYDVTARTVLPHLEENLRYATERKLRCLGTSSATDLFPVFEHPSFDGCSLAEDESAPEPLRFSIECSNPEAASGIATFSIEPHRFNGTLEIKMGGKNMGFTQIVTGSRTGDCIQQ